MDEAEALARACALARRGLGDVEPNPPVGAVVLATRGVVGEGWHAGFGGPHAEIVALAEAGPRVRGATLCVSLEPCSTQGKTPACTRAILTAGLARVVVGCRDPNPAHAGRGLDELRAAGLQVELVDSEAARALLQRFERGLSARRPHVLAKWAMSQDGALAGPGSTPVALTGTQSRRRVHAWRAHADAIMVGVQTVLQDDPRLTVRKDARPVRPLRRVVLDPHLRIRPTCELVSSADETPTWVCTTDAADSDRAQALSQRGVRVLRVPAGDAWLGGVLAALHLEGVRRVLLEGGARTLARALAAGVVDQVAVFVASRRLGPGALPAVEGLDLADLEPEVLADRLALDEVRVERVGPDLLVRGFRPA